MAREMLGVTSERLGMSVEGELDLLRKLGRTQGFKVSKETLNYLKARGNGKRGRPRKYHSDRPASVAERVKAFRARKKAEAKA